MDKRFFDQFYAKSDGVTTLEQHTRHVITAGLNLLNSLSLNEDEKKYWRDKFIRCAVLHDLGKIHKEFIKRLNDEKGVPIRHEIVSLLFCVNYLQIDDDELFAIATHHKGVVDDFSKHNVLSQNEIGVYVQQWYELDRTIFTRDLIESWLKIFDINIPLKEQAFVKLLPRKIKQMLSFEYQSKAVLLCEERKKLSFARSLLIASDHLGSARKENDIPQYKLLTLADFRPGENGVYFSFRPFQERMQQVKMNAILHAPTGSGKTEAALNWIYANQRMNARIFYLLPYTASINAMVGRLQQHFDKELVTAVHSKTLDFFYDQLSEEYSNRQQNIEELEQEARSRKSLSKEIFYPVKVTTLHQVLKISLKGKGWELSLLDYQNALFIVDEFHTYNALLTGLLLASVKLFKKLFDAKFLFLSATIPDFMLSLIVNEVFEGDKACLIRPDRNEQADRIIMDRKRHQLYMMDDLSILDKIDLISSYLKKYSVLVIVNNVKTAQALYEEIDFEGNVQLLHGGFNRRDRIRIEKEITNEDILKRPQLLIATQAVEVSLDIDYDIAFIENAPIDALIQRFGRINRAGKKKIPPLDREYQPDNKTVPVYVFEQSINKTPFYDNTVLKNTWDELSTLSNNELGEDDLIYVCNQVYKNGYNEKQQQEFNNGLNHPIIRKYEEDWIAGHSRDWVEEVLDGKNQKIEVLCFNLQEEYHTAIAEKRFVEANQLLVQVYREEVAGKLQLDRGVWLAYELDYNSVLGYMHRKYLVDDLFL